jgi:branched-chain amino acid transport system permease protein
VFFNDLVSFVTLASLYLLFALGMSLTWGTIDVLNFSHGSVFMFSAFAGYLLLGDARLSLPVLLLIGIAVGAVLAFLIQALAFEQILRRAQSKPSAEMQVLIAGIGIATIPVAIAQRHTRSNPFGFSGSSFKVDTWVLGSLRLSNISLITVVVGVVLWTVAALWLRRSRQGLALRAIGVSADTASLMGINRRRMALAAMTVSGALAGLCGVLFTFGLGVMDPESGNTLLLKAFAIIILGGAGSMLGLAVGSVVLAAAETLVLTQTNGSWVDALSFGLIFVVLLIRPSGLFGRKEVRRT